jgi:hypothetical protein
MKELGRLFAGGLLIGVFLLLLAPIGAWFCPHMGVLAADCNSAPEKGLWGIMSLIVVGGVGAVMYLAGWGVESGISALTYWWRHRCDKNS